MGKITLECFRIENLNNEKNVSLTFKENIRILLGENGSGKTTILTALYFLLSKKYYKLNNLEFNKMHLDLSSGETLTLEKKWFSLEEDEDIYRLYSYLENTLNKQELDYALSIIYGEGDIEEFRVIFRKSLLKKDILMSKVRRTILDIRNILKERELNIFGENILKFDKGISKAFEKEILYFPTYRRIEEDLAKLGLNMEDNIPKSNGIINFGMGDVQELFKKIKNDIKEESLNSYSNATGNMIKHLIYPSESETQEETGKKIQKNKEIIGVVLDRFGTDLSDKDKENISSLINSKQIFDKEYYSLSFYLNSLINNYLKFKERDDSIKEFTRICTKYLLEKKLVFEESNGEIKIINDKTNNEIELNKLSSGEKQIISILSQVFLNFEDDFIILFDEPELSLSIEWQEMLLPDILNSKKCSLLFAVTHSPFIFDNNLDKYAQGIEMFMTESENNV